jgi:cell division protein FtsZ
VPLNEPSAVIKVIGVGGGGSNTTDYMVLEAVEGVDFICMNTDKQALDKSKAGIKLQLGDAITRGLGAGANPEIGKQSAEADEDKIREMLQGADMVFIIAGMGGGTGTGAAPVVARIAKEMGILTVVVVTKPFVFEGRKRMSVAEEGIKNLSPHADSIIIIPNNKLLNVLGKNVSLLNAFKAANNVSLGAVQGIAELITRPGLINVDFADVRTVMSEMGMAMMGTGVATGENRARAAAEAAISSPLLEDVDLSGAKGILVNITAGMGMSIGEFEEVGDIIKSFASEDATVVVGTVIDPEMDDAGRDGRREEMRVTIVVTGLGKITDSPVTFSASVEEKPDYQKLERPTILRKHAATSSTNSLLSTSTTNTSITTNKTEPTLNANEIDYLDIPAFLRRQEKEEA